MITYVKINLNGWDSFLLMRMMEIIIWKTQKKARIIQLFYYPR